MATPVEMMMKQVFKALGVNPDEVMKHVEGIRATVAHVGNTVALILSLLLMANRRLHRIEAKLGLDDIEPVPDAILQTTVIDNEHSQSSSVVVAPLGRGDHAGAR